MNFFRRPAWAELVVSSVLLVGGGGACSSAAPTSGPSGAVESSLSTESTGSCVGYSDAWQYGDGWATRYYRSTTGVNDACPGGYCESYNACDGDSCQENCLTSACNIGQNKCQKNTCQNAGWPCGPISDGCGGTLNCSCPNGTTCSSGVCVSDPPTSVCSGTGDNGSCDGYCFGTGGFCDNGQCYCGT